MKRAGRHAACRRQLPQRRPRRRRSAQRTRADVSGDNAPVRGRPAGQGLSVEWGRSAARTGRQRRHAVVIVTAAGARMARGTLGAATAGCSCPAGAALGHGASVQTRDRRRQERVPSGGARGALGRCVTRARRQGATLFLPRRSVGLGSWNVVSDKQHGRQPPASAGAASCMCAACGRHARAWPTCTASASAQPLSPPHDRSRHPYSHHLRPVCLRAAAAPHPHTFF